MSMEMKYKTYEEAMEYQDFVMEVLSERLGLVISNYSSKKYQYGRGENRQGIEIKLDNRISPQGNISIELFEKSIASNYLWVKSGILREDNTWLYVQGNYEYIFIFSKKRLQELYNKEYRDKVWDPKPTIRTFLIPFEKAKEICEKFIQINEIKEDRNGKIR